MNGKIRVSIVATSLDGEVHHSKTVLNMVDRIQNKASVQSENLFSKNIQADLNTMNSIEGATALKLEDEVEVNNLKRSDIQHDPKNVPSGLSIESASYIENNLNHNLNLKENYVSSDHTPNLFVEDDLNDQFKNSQNLSENKDEKNEELFDHDSNDDDEFEIPAFLRRQKVLMNFLIIYEQIQLSTGYFSLSSYVE